ncbi:TUBA3, partial [Symbiodinium microadriaticum]
LNGKEGEVLSWHEDRWIVDMKDTEPKERKSFKPENLVIVPERVTKKRKAEEPPPEEKKIKLSDLRDLESSDETVVAKCLLRLLREFEIVAQKCVCVLATKTSMTVMNELAAHITDKQADGLLRRQLKPNEKVAVLRLRDVSELIGGHRGILGRP